ncbi:RNase adapter RapZ [Persicimonas caeni]|uniref:RNase adapter RapZ n=2 Tax=Persicimonas caeni TaxID=2292766 RepID=A0A4Y6Q3Z9_PERCE|nr:RNase adapter RapZ [Persicimonas caeni]QED36099.1 RNase adapter RapZ [Persicimonas caeni]
MPVLQKENSGLSADTESSVVELTENSAVPRVVVLTGLSGSGKSTAIHALEDLGYFCIDNLPVPLLPKVVELGAGGGSLQSLAFVVDTRGREFLSEAGEMVEQMRDEGVPMRIVFLEAAEDVLVRRYSETRRRHPLAEDGVTIREGIRRDRERLEELRHRADEVIDTSSHTVHTLKSLIQQRFSGDKEPSLQVTVLSFGFKHGVPVECDLVFDVRFLPNPYFVEELREGRGNESDVRDYVLSFPETSRFLSLFQEMADFMLPMYRREGKSYLTIGIGCTGGHHRSVAVSETISERLKTRGWQASVRHRDIAK